MELTFKDYHGDAGGYKVGELIKHDDKIGVVTKVKCIECIHSTRTHGQDKITDEVTIDYSKKAVVETLAKAGVELGKPVRVSVKFADKDAFKQQFAGNYSFNSDTKTWWIKELTREHFDELNWWHSRGFNMDSGAYSSVLWTYIKPGTWF